MQQISSYPTMHYSWKSFVYLAVILTVSFMIRAFVLYAFIQPHGYYKQADSFDYHNCALSIATGNGMHSVPKNIPVFWRTPGYPAYLAVFYRWFGIISGRFEQNRTAQEAALWVQIILASFIPIILFFLTLTLTHITVLAYIVAWIATLHPGLVLASTYLLSEGIALIFFYLFLLFLFQRFTPSGHKRSWLFSTIAAALMLGIYTWMRPMGEFVGYVTALLLAFAPTRMFKQRAKEAALFLIIFLLTLAPWYYRNYRLTGEYFFCPTIGTYLTCFSVPKLLRRTLRKPILECHQIAQQAAMKEVQKQQSLHPNTYISQNACKAVAFPIIRAHPLYFVYDWILEVIKTVFDLYSYQLVTMFEGTYWYDPIEEYLPDKIRVCLSGAPLPLSAHLIAWLELLWMLFCWIGIIGGIWLFLLQPFWKHSRSFFTQNMHTIWIAAVPLIGIIVGMTGGFGYARLRLPAEPLLIILSLAVWYHWVKKGKQS